MSNLISCPECTKHLQVPDELIGKKVQCPECKHTFSAQVTPTESVSSVPKPKPKPPATIPKKKPAWEKDDDPPEEDPDADSYGVKKGRHDDDDEEDDRDDDRDDDRPSRRRRRRNSSRGGRHTLPHRGGLILAMGLLALLTGLGFIFGPIAWIMGNSDLNDIRNGRMDPEGEGLVQTGRILGIIATILSIVSVIVFFGFFGCACCLPIIGAAGNNRNNFNRPPRRF